MNQVPSLGGPNTHPSRSRARFRGAAVAFGIVGLICSWWSCAILMLVAGKVLVVTSHIDGYRPATFTVVKPIYRKSQSGHGSQAQVSGRIYAEGTVGGAAEELDLGAYLKTTPKSQAQLEREVRAGQELPVLYNPDVPDTVAARVLFPRKDFKGFWMRYRARTFRVAYLPFAIALGLSLLATAAARSWAGVKLGAASMVFVIAGWLLVGLNVFTH